MINHKACRTGSELVYYDIQPDSISVSNVYLTFNKLQVIKFST
jgi:hypothetical protein